MLKTLAIFMFIVGVFIFGMSYHNIDLSFNAKNGSIDTNGFGYTQTIPQMYMNGMAGLGISVVMLISGFSMLFRIKDNAHVIKNE